MDTKKFEKIKDFLMMWGYTRQQLAEYLEQVAPGMASNGQKARDQRTRDFFDSVLGRPVKAVEPTKIPKPDDLNNKGIAYDLWLLLGLGDNAVMLDDLADYIAERTSATEEEKGKAAQADKMAMSNMLRDLNTHERVENARFIAEITERAERLQNQNTNMSELLRNLHTQADSTPHTLRFDDPAKKNNPMNNQLRGLSADNRA